MVSTVQLRLLTVTVTWSTWSNSVVRYCSDVMVTDVRRVGL